MLRGIRSGGESMTDELSDRIKSVPLFAGFSNKEIQRVAGIAKEVHFREGKEIARQGESGVGFHMIVEGEASVSVDGVEHAVLKAGSYFGEMSLLDGRPRSATVTARTDLTTVSMTSWDFNGLLDQYPELARKLLIELCRRLRATESSVAE
jgi:CRP-like cAMP-binding protein